MEAWYPLVFRAHVAAVVASGALFFLRGLALNVFGAAWAMARPIRWLSIAIDTVLLGAAILLAIIIRQYPLVNPWLTTKVGLLIFYIGLGSFALKRARTRAARTG